jgi:ABC-type sugar transport system substrate-binding protein
MILKMKEERRSKMKKANRILTLVLAVFMITALLVSCGGTDSGTGNDTSAAKIAPLGNGKDIYKDELKIAWIPLSTAGQINEIIDITYQDALSMYPNIELVTFDPGYDVNKQISMISECITQEFDAIILLPLDTAACNNAITEAEKAGIPVVTVDCGATATHTFHLQGSDYGSGLMAGEKVSEALGGKGNIIVLDAPAEQKAIGRMGTGFIDYIKANTECTILEDVSIPMWSQENANTTMRDLLTKYDDIDAVYGASDDIAVGAMQAIQAAGRDKDGIIIYGNVGMAPALEAIKNGTMYGTNYSDTYAHFSTIINATLMFIQTGLTSVTAGYTETPVVYDSLIPVTKENVDYIMDVSRYFR